MSCKTAIYAVNTASQAYVATGTVINFGSIVRRFGCGLNVSGGNVETSASGYYAVDVNVTITPTTAASTSIQIYKDGVAVPGAVATISTTAADTYAVTIPAIIRDTCNCTSTLTVSINGSAGAIDNAAITVEKL